MNIFPLVEIDVESPKLLVDDPIKDDIKFHILLLLLLYIYILPV